MMNTIYANNLFKENEKIREGLGCVRKAKEFAEMVDI